MADWLADVTRVEGNPHIQNRLSPGPAVEGFRQPPTLATIELESFMATRAGRPAGFTGRKLLRVPIPVSLDA